MGQRHQLFVKIKNPLKQERITFEGEDLKRANKIFGKGKFSVLAFHHQWLYGKSAAVNVIETLKKCNPETAASYSPFAVDGWYQDLDRWLNQVTAIISVQTSELHPRGIGYEGFSFLNESEPDMRSHCDYGDNNDGITIIDAVEQKYCMMNMCDEDHEYISIYNLPKLYPADTRAYLKLYYPETVTGAEDVYAYRKFDGAKIRELVKENIQNNGEVSAITNKFDVLTIAELKKIFPAMRKQFVQSQLQAS